MNDMTDKELVNGLCELAKTAPTQYLFGVAKNAAARIVELRGYYDFACKQNKQLGAVISAMNRKTER